ncbi:hypothetical protein LG293_17205 (plasmid) [Citricoccus nitrophenolicus]
MSGHWAHQPRTPQGVRTGGEWEIGLLAESGLSLARPDAPDTVRHPARWPRIPRAFEQFTVGQRSLIMRCLPYYDPDEGLTPRNLDALRATINEATSNRFSGSDENHRLISHAARLVADAHGGAHQMVIGAGKHVSARAEQIAGVTDEEVAADSAEMVIHWREQFEMSREAVEDYRREHPDVNHTPYSTRHREATVQFNRARSGRDKDTMEAVTSISQARRQALSEVIDLGGELNLHDRSTKKAIEPFEVASSDFPSSWLEHSGQQGPLLLRYSSDRNHYRFRAEVKSEKTAPAVVERDIQAGTQHEQGPTYEPVRLVRSGTGHRGEPVETWEFTLYETARTTGKYLNKLDKRYAGYDRRRNGYTATGGWKPAGDGEHERRQLREVVESQAEYVPMANTGGDKSAGLVNGPEGEHGVSTAAHELTHHMEKTIPSFYELERAFWRERTEGSEYHEYMGSKTEVYKDGGFANIYIGKDYNYRSTSEHQATEIGSMGMEMLFHGKHGAFAGTAGKTPDPQMRDFMLGTLVAVDPSREAIRTGIPVFAPSSHRPKTDSLFGRRGTTVVTQQQLPGGKVRVQLSDGRTGEVDPEEIVVG